MNSNWAQYAWVPITLFAALAQTGRNAAQRSLVAQAGTMGATLARFLYGLPLAGLWVLALYLVPGTGAVGWPAFGGRYVGWLLLGAAGQLFATACLLAAMKQRNFVIGVAFSKTDALQVALFSTVLLHEWPSVPVLLAMLVATAGVLLLSPRGKGGTITTDGPTPWAGWAVVYGLASGAGFALCAVGFRGAALALPDVSPWVCAAWSVLLAQAIQSVALGAWLLWRDASALRSLVTQWRVSMTAGGAGALASIAWFTAFAMTSAVHVRTLGMVEVVFSYAVSHFVLHEHTSWPQRVGLTLILAGVLGLVLA